MDRKKIKFTSPKLILWMNKSHVLQYEILHREEGGEREVCSLRSKCCLRIRKSLFDRNFSPLLPIRPLITHNNGNNLFFFFTSHSLHTYSPFLSVIDTFSGNNKNNSQGNQQRDHLTCRIQGTRRRKQKKNNTKATITTRKISIA